MLSGINAGVDPISFGVRSGRGGHVPEPVDQRSDDFAVAFQCLSFLVGEAELLKHLLDAVLNREKLAAAGVLDVEVAVGAGQPVPHLAKKA